MTYPCYRWRIANHSEFFDEVVWAASITSGLYYGFYYERTSTEKRTQRYIRATLNRLYAEDVSAYTPAIPTLEEMAGVDIWTSIEDTDELASLSTL